MSNSLGHLVPKYAAPADWLVERVIVTGTIKEYLVRRTGLYLTVQAELDDLVTTSLAQEIPLVFISIPPMGFTQDERLNNPGAYYPTPALMAELLSQSGPPGPTGATGPQGPAGPSSGVISFTIVEYTGTAWPTRPSLTAGYPVMWINRTNDTLPPAGAGGYIADLDVALVMLAV